MNAEQIKEFIQGGEWVSIAPELRPSSIKNADGSLKPFYLTRAFKYSADDTFELDIINSADAYGKIPLVRIVIKGHIVWQGDHPIAAGAQKVNFIADKAYEVTAFSPGFCRCHEPGCQQGIQQMGSEWHAKCHGESLCALRVGRGTDFRRIRFDLHIR